MILVTQIGARRHYAVSAALERAGLLAGLVTDVCMAAPWLRMLGRVVPRSWPVPGWKSLAAREVVGVPDEKIACLWSAPWKLSRFKHDADYGGQYARFAAHNAAFGREVVERGFGDAKGVYAFNGAAVEIFRAAKERGLKCILDMTIAPLEVVERLLVEERARFPEYLLGTVASDPADTLIAREREEWGLADLILCGSEYVLDSLMEAGVTRSKCRVVRWGYSGAMVPLEQLRHKSPAFAIASGITTDERGFSTSYSEKLDLFHVLIAGTVELRKGVPYALQAAEMLSRRAGSEVHFRFVGPVHLSSQGCRKDAYGGTAVCFEGPAPRSEMSRIYQEVDVLLHPSLAEGSANVCYEAMAHGLPVIATPNAGSAITDGVDGIIVPIRDPDAIAAALTRLRDDRELRMRMGEAARRRAAMLTIEQYQQQLAEAVRQVLP